MLLGLKISFILLCFGMGIQDLLQRHIYAFFFPLLALLGVSIQYCISGWTSSLLYSLINFVMILIALGVLWVYTYFRKIKFINHSMGSGDILMLFVMGVSFTPYTFLMLWLCSSLISLCIHGLIFKSKTIPYAGYIAFCSIALLILLEQDQFFSLLQTPLL